MTDAAKYGRGIENHGTDRKGIWRGVGNPGVFLRNETISGVPYARYRADQGTWVSSSMKQLGYDRLYGADTAFGAYRGLVRHPDGRTLTSPDQIRPGQEYLIPRPTDRQLSAAAPQQPRQSQSPPLLVDEGLSQILDFLTGRGRPRPNPGDPPANMPSNVTKRSGLHEPGFPSTRPIFGNQELSLQRWVYEACQYNDVPVLVMAAILQEENKPGATEWTRFLQATERWGQTELGGIDELGLGKVLGGFRLWRRAARGATGIANLSRDTLREAAAYVERIYRRPAIPDSLRRETADPRRAGLDMELDLYYMSALLRRLIDKEVSPGHRGNISDEQLYRVARDYNGSGREAEEYGRKLIARLNEVRKGRATYFFLGEPPGQPSLQIQIDAARGLGF
jgi:hypothetical protein